MSGPSAPDRMRGPLASALALAVLVTACSAADDRSSAAPTAIRSAPDTSTPAAPGPDTATTAPSHTREATRASPSAAAPGETSRAPSSGPESQSPAAVRSVEPAPSDAALAAALQPVLDEWLDEAGSPGAVLGVRLADGRTAVVAAGDADVEGGNPVLPGDRFRIGSITKTFMATLILGLVEDGLIALDDTLDRHVPEAAHGERVTIAQLLDHTSGIHDFAALSEYRNSMLRSPGRTWAPADIVALVADRELDFEPGAGWAYSNTNYVLLGMAAERVTGEPLAALLRARIYEPLGLDSTYLDELEPSPPVAINGHFDVDGDGTPDNLRALPYTALVTSGAAAGGISASAHDVLDFASGLFGGELVAETTLSRMLEVAPPAQDYALGIDRQTVAGRTAWGHGGALPGFSTMLAHFPDERVTVIAMTNETGVSVDGVVARALEAALTVGE